jgi:DNA polymerase III subunit delta
MMIVTLTGANDFSRSRTLDELVTAFVGAHTDMALERLDGEDSSVERLQESLQSLPFLTDRKLVVLREPGKQKAFAERIADILQTIPETTDVVIVEPKLDKRLTYYKTLKKQTDFREHNELDANGLAAWAADYVRTAGGSLSTADGRLLIDRLGTNQQLLCSELNKLLLYGSHITKQTIELLTDRLPQSTIFELLDAVFAGNARRALDVYKEQRALRVEPQAIVAMLAWQLHVLAVVKSGAPRPVDDIARGAKLNPFVVRKSQGIVRSLPMARLKQMIYELLQLDIRLKRSSIDADEALQLYLLQLATPT